MIEVMFMNTLVVTEVLSTLEQGETSLWLLVSANIYGNWGAKTA